MQQLSPSQSSPEAPINENFETLSASSIFGKRHPATSGLTWGYYGGLYNGNTVADGTVTLADNATNYVVVLRASGVVSVSSASTNSVDPTYSKLYKLTTASGVVIATVDQRTDSNGLLFSGAGGSTGGGSSSASIAATAWVEVGGNDSTAVLSNSSLPFATINAALTALPANGGNLRLGIGTFDPFTHDYDGSSSTPNAASKLKSNVRFLGSGMPALDSYSAPTRMVDGSGTVIRGGVVIHSTHHNVKFFDLGLDAGSVVMAAQFSGGIRDGLVWFNLNQTVGLAPCRGAEAHNVIVLCKTASSAVHGIAFENCFDHAATNIHSYYGVHGLAVKSVRGVIDGVHSWGHGSDVMIVKEGNTGNNSAPCYGCVITNVVGGELASGDTPTGLIFETADTRPLENIQIGNVSLKGISTTDIRTSVQSSGPVRRLRIDNFNSDNVAIRYNLAPTYTDKTSIFVNGEAIDGEVPLTDATSIATDGSVGNNFRFTLGGNRTLANPTNLKGGQVYNFRVIQDGTGSRTLAYGSKFKWVGGVAPTLSTAVGARDFISAQYSATDDTLYCSIMKAVA